MVSSPCILHPASTTDLFVCQFYQQGRIQDFPLGSHIPGGGISKMLLCRYTTDQDPMDILTFPMHDAGNISKIPFEFQV